MILAEILLPKKKHTGTSNALKFWLTKLLNELKFYIGICISMDLLCTKNVTFMSILYQQPRNRIRNRIRSKRSGSEIRMRIATLLFSLYKPPELRYVLRNLFGFTCEENSDITSSTGIRFYRSFCKCLPVLWIRNFS
jgi:hypothetical protein